MNKQRCDSTIKQLCRTCGKAVLECVCQPQPDAARWPTSGGVPRSEGEMTERFMKLKQAGEGTIFKSPSGASKDSPTITIDLVSGAVIGGVYQIIELIGRGGMGEVYLAKHLTLNKKCALKVIPPNEVTEVSWKRFQLEARAVARLEHVNLVKVTDLGIHEGCLPYYAMDYLDGQNLAEVLADTGPLPIDKALEVFMQVCDGVECAHRGGILHRDLKPANIMLMRTATGRIDVKILDFGLAKLMKHSRQTQSLTGVGETFGSPSYMSPEQVSGEELDNRSDIYSIGCSLFETLTGRPPFYGQQVTVVLYNHLDTRAPSLEAIVGHDMFSPSMELVMARLLRKNPADRYQTLSELRADLAAIAQGRQLVSPPTGSFRRFVATLPPEPEVVAEKEGEKPFFVPAKVWAPVGVCLLLILSGGAFSFLHKDGLSAHKEIKGSDLVSAARTGEGGDASLAGVASHPAADGEANTPDGSVSVSPAATVASEKHSLSWDGTPFYRGIVDRGGKRFKSWLYLGNTQPPAQLIGWGAIDIDRIPLAGKVLLPVESRVCLQAKQPLIKEPELLKGLNGADFDGVDFDWYTLDDARTLTPFISTNRALRWVKLGNFSWSAKDCRDSISLINQFPYLERLALFAQYDDASLLQIKRLKDLKEIRLGIKQEHLHQCLQAIAKARSLRSFGLAEWTGPDDDLTQLARCPALTSVFIGQMPGTHEQIEALSRLPRLQRLELPQLAYRPGLPADLKQLKSLKTLRFLLPGWSGDQIESLKAALPNVTIATYTSGHEERSSLGWAGSLDHVD